MKAQTKVQHGCDITIGVDHGSLRLQLPQRHKIALEMVLGRSLAGKPNYLPLGKHGFKDNPTDHKRAGQIAIAIEGDLDHPEWDKLFDFTLAKYGLGDGKYAKLASVTQMPGTVATIPEITVGVMWEAYLEWKKTTIEETTFKARYGGMTNVVNGKVWLKKEYKFIQSDNPLSECKLNEKSAIELAFNSIIIANKSHLSSSLIDAFELCKTKGLLVCSTTENPFVSDKYNVPELTTQQKYATKIVNGEEKKWHEVADEKMLEVDRRSFSLVERDIIIKAFYNSDKSVPLALAPLIEFYFLTGCRTSEAVALVWSDIDFVRNIIRFNKSMGVNTGKIKDTKTGEARLFYFSEHSRLKGLLMKLKAESSNDLVFPNKNGKHTSYYSVVRAWYGRESTQSLADGTDKEYRYRGIVAQLAQEGAIGGYLSPYHTRHTYITLTAHANSGNNNALLHIASSCGNSVDVILRHYLGVNESIELVEV